VGGAIISDGKVLAGAHGFSGEIGHALTTYSEIVCKCGRVGCLDTIASGFAFTQALGYDWFHRADVSLKTHLERLATGVANSAKACVELLDVDTVILVGWPARHAFVRNALRVRLNSTCRKVAFFPKGWPLSIWGALEINATHWRSK
jgi:predicted NBD/HSP70 family sugar kinase